MREYSLRAYECAKNHGFYDQLQSSVHERMMIVCEVAEAVSADRKGHHADVGGFLSSDRSKGAFERYIKDSFEDELADIFLRYCSAWFHMTTEPIDYIVVAQAKRLDYMPWILKESFPEHAYDMCQLMYFDDSFWIKDLFLFYLFRWVYAKDIHLDWFIEQKMKYNESRPVRNGKRY